MLGITTNINNITFLNCAINSGEVSSLAIHYHYLTKSDVLLSHYDFKGDFVVGGVNHSFGF